MEPDYIEVKINKSTTMKDILFDVTQKLQTKGIILNKSTIPRHLYDNKVLDVMSQGQILTIEESKEEPKNTVNYEQSFFKTIKDVYTPRPNASPLINSPQSPPSTPGLQLYSDLDLNKPYPKEFFEDQTTIMTTAEPMALSLDKSCHCCKNIKVIYYACPVCKSKYCKRCFEKHSKKTLKCPKCNKICTCASCMKSIKKESKS
ncbi:hypothetical protein QTN25_002189 [Entamoeba marina]